jgi:XTP/dITP diphosphohydrolase
MDNTLLAFKKLVDIMDELREKCPWDSKQTMETLRTLTIEETYELGDAILADNPIEVRKELGDLLLHIVFYSKLGAEKNQFTLEEVINGICDKLVFRHPHVFGDVTVQDDEEVKANWETLKLKEGNKSVLAGVPKSLPALVKAYRIQDKARSAGFDWEEKKQVWTKVKEEMDELKVEIEQGNEDNIEAEFGDLFFSLVNAARLYDVNPEDALERTNHKFINRFNYLESMTIKKGHSLKEMTLAQMDVLWEEAKKLEKMK